MSGPEQFISPGARDRQNLFDQYKVRLNRLAFKHLARGNRREDLLAVVIDVDDPNTSDIVEMVMPGHDWQQYRDRGERPVASGLVKQDEFLHYLSETSVGIDSLLRAPIPTHSMRTIVLASGGISVFAFPPVNPRPRPKQRRK